MISQRGSVGYIELGAGVLKRMKSQSCPMRSVANQELKFRCYAGRLLFCLLRPKPVLAPLEAMITDGWLLSQDEKLIETMLDAYEHAQSQDAISTRVTTDMQYRIRKVELDWIRGCVIEATRA